MSNSFVNPCDIVWYLYFEYLPYVVISLALPFIPIAIVLVFYVPQSDHILVLVHNLYQHLISQDEESGRAQGVLMSLVRTNRTDVKTTHNNNKNTPRVPQDLETTTPTSKQKQPERAQAHTSCCVTPHYETTAPWSSFFNRTLQYACFFCCSSALFILSAKKKKMGFLRKPNAECDALTTFDASEIQQRTLRSPVGPSIPQHSQTMHAAAERLKTPEV